MTTLLAPNRTDLPPPRTSTLSDAGSVVGWLTHDTIGFGGFANEADAMAAAWMAHRTLARRRARRDGTRPVPIDTEPLSLARDGRREAIVASGRSIATLIRPGGASPSGPDSFGFEVSVPARHDPARLRDTAFLLYRTLRRSGIRWALFQADQRADAPQDARDASHHSPDARAATEDVAAEPVAADAETSGPRPRDVDEPRGGWRRVAHATAPPAIVAVAVLLPMLTTGIIVSVLGGIAAVVALVGLAALVRLVVTDLWRDGQPVAGRRGGRAPRAYAKPTPFASQLGRHLSAYHRVRSGR